MKQLKYAALFASIGAAIVSFPAQAQQLSFMTGPQGGAWYPLGGAMAEIMAQDLGVPMHEGALAFYEANGITP